MPSKSTSSLRTTACIFAVALILSFVSHGQLPGVEAPEDRQTQRITRMAEVIRLMEQGAEAEARALILLCLESAPEDPALLGLLAKIESPAVPIAGVGGVPLPVGAATPPESRSGEALEMASHGLEKELQVGKACFLGGDYQGAISVLAPLASQGDARAQALLQGALAAQAQLESLERSATRSAMLAEVTRSWQRPRVATPETPSAEGAWDGGPLLQKIRSIRIPRVHFSNMEMTAVIETLSELSVEYDVDSPVGQKGVNIVPLFDPNTRANPKISISLRQLSLEKILQFITQQVNFQFDIVEDAILVQPGDGPDGTANLLTEFFPLSRATVIRISGTGRDAPEGTHRSPFDPSPTLEASGEGNPEEAAIRSFFQRAGVDFDGIRGASIAFDGTQLIATQTSRNLERMRNILRRYEKTRQVEIEAKFLEVQQQDLEELGFDWMIRAAGRPVFDSAGNPVMTPTGAHLQQYDSVIDAASGSRSLAQAFNLDPHPGGIRIHSPQLEGGVFREPVLAPQLPQSLHFAQEVAGGLLSSVRLIGKTEVGVLVRALSRKEGTDLLSAPRLTVLSGKTASITVAQELRYPERFSDMQAEVSRGSSAADGGGGAAVAITSGTPQDFSVRNVGVEMEVTPTVEDDDNISLVLEPQVTEFEGFVEYGGPSVAISGGMTATIPAGFYQPVFSTRRVRTEVTMYDGATVVIGGLTREEVKAVHDKVPILGDIPLLGRLFRSEGEVARKRNLLIFVTANLIGPGGGPIKQSFPDMDPNTLFQNPSLLTPAGSVARGPSEPPHSKRP
jgi:general secretion pathway protein D